MQQKQIIILILDFLEGICDQEYMFQKFTFIKSSHWNMCHVFPKRWMARVNNCLVSPLLGKALFLEFLIHTDPKLFWIVCQNGSFWSIAVWDLLIPHSSMCFSLPSQKWQSFSSSSSCTSACLLSSEPLPLLAHIYFQLENGEQGVLYSARAYSSGKKKGRWHLHNSKKSFWPQPMCTCN